MPKLGIRTHILTFDDVGYPEFTALAWTSAPMAKTDAFFACKDETEIRNFILELFPEWNFCDQDGNEIPHDLDAFPKLPKELIMEMVKKYTKLINGIPEDFVIASPNTSAAAN